MDPKTLRRELEEQFENADLNADLLVEPLGADSTFEGFRIEVRFREFPWKARNIAVFDGNILAVLSEGVFVPYGSEADYVQELVHELEREVENEFRLEGASAALTEAGIASSEGFEGIRVGATLVRHKGTALNLLRMWAKTQGCVRSRRMDSVKMDGLRILCVN